MKRRPWLSAALLLGTALGVAGAASVKVQPQGEALTRAVQAALGAISSKELPVTLDSSSGTVMTLGGTGSSAAAFNPDVSARVVTVGGARRIEFNPSGPLPLAQAVQQELARELGFKDWTAEAARTRLSGADLNGDGRIDLIDLSILMENYGKAGSVGDLNQDRKVDDADLRIFSGQYRPQLTVPEPEPEPVPAPAQTPKDQPPQPPAAPQKPAPPASDPAAPTTPAAPGSSTAPPAAPLEETAPKDAAPGAQPSSAEPSPASPEPEPTPPTDPAPKQP